MKKFLFATLVAVAFTACTETPEEIHGEPGLELDTTAVQVDTVPAPVEDTIAE